MKHLKIILDKENKHMSIALNPEAQPFKAEIELEDMYLFFYNKYWEIYTQFIHYQYKFYLFIFFMTTNFGVLSGTISYSHLFIQKPRVSSSTET